MSENCPILFPEDLASKERRKRLEEFQEHAVDWRMFGWGILFWLGVAALISAAWRLAK